MKKLTEEQIEQRLKGRQNWTVEGEAICRTFAFGDFSGAIDFVNSVAEAARIVDHHPDIDIRYDEVTLRISTHDVGGLTGRDFALAQAVDALV